MAMTDWHCPIYEYFHKTQIAPAIFLESFLSLHKCCVKNEICMPLINYDVMP